VPDPSYLMVSIVFSSIGMGYFIYGKKQKRKIIYYTGVGLFVYPYFVTAVPAMIATGIALMFAPKILSHFDIG
jgi:hypothetical protein